MRHRMALRPRVESLEVRDTPALFHVAPGGSDGNPGTEAAPLQTLQAAANRVAPGDTVQVGAGAYRGFHLTTSGTAAARITFQADPAAAPGAVVINQPNLRTNQDGVNLEGASFVTVEGFTVTGQPRAGIRAVENEFVTIRNNVADGNTSWGIFTGFSSDLLIENNQTSRSQREHGIYVSNSGDRPVVRGNTSFENRGGGIQLNADASMGGDGIISNAVIENNVLRANGAGGGASINLDGVQDSDIRNNLIDNARATGIALFRQGGAAGSSNNRVVNNTVVVDNSLNQNNGRWAVAVNGGSTGNLFRNNILFSTHGFRGAIAASADSLPGLVSDYNAIEDRVSVDDGGSGISLVQWRQATGQDLNSFALTNLTALNALFANRAGGDIHLAPGGGAVDRGTAAGAPARDFEGQPRPSGAGVDIGASEYQVVSTPPAPVPPMPPPPAPVPPPAPMPPPPAPGGFADNFSSATPNPVWAFVGGNWVQSGGVLSQTATAAGDPRKAIPAGQAWSADQEVVASVRVDAWQAGDYARAGVGVRTDPATGHGYNLLFHGQNRVQFLSDYVAWGNSYTFDWQPGAWYQFKLRAEGTTLLGKVWATGQAEPANWMFTQTGWTDRTGGVPGLNGGSSGDGRSTASFDDVTAANVTAPTPAGPLYSDDFSAAAPAAAVSFANGDWAQGGGVIRQTGTAAGGVKQAVVTGVPGRVAQEVQARVRVDAWQAGDYARAGVGVGVDPATGHGYNLLFHGNNRVEFLHDYVTWGNGYTFNWQPGGWYQFKLRQEADGTLRGKVWADGQAEPAGWMFTQTGWAARSGHASLNGGAAAPGQGSSTVSFDDLVVRV